MKKFKNRVLLFFSGFLILSIVVFFLTFHYNKSVIIANEIESPKGFCGTTSVPLNNKAQKGKKIFNIHCATCHSLDRRMSGPSLRGLLKSRDYPYKTFVYDFISKEDSLINIRDEYTLAINNEYEMEFSHNFNFDNTEFENLMEYLKD